MICTRPILNTIFIHVEQISNIKDVPEMKDFCYNLIGNGLPEVTKRK